MNIAYIFLTLLLFQTTHLNAMMGASRDEADSSGTVLLSRHTIVGEGSIVASGRAGTVHLAGDTVEVKKGSVIQASHVILEGKRIVNEGSITAERLICRTAH